MTDLDLSRVEKKPPRELGRAERAARMLSALSMQLLGRRRQDAFGILMYHRVVDPPPGLPEPTWNVPPSVFEEQLAGLLRRGSKPWPLRRVLEHRETGKPIPSDTFVVTFDDGFENNCTQAFPILEKLRVPATIFAATAYIDSPHPYPGDDWIAAGDPQAPAESWRPMTWEQCRALQESQLVEIGAHTHSHQDFRDRPDVLYHDLLECRRMLQERLGIDRPTFAFPFGTKHNGFVTPSLVDSARRAGMQCSLTTESRRVLPHHDPFDWGRFPAENFDTSATLAAKLSGWQDFYRDAWRSLKRRPT